jgi:hypothetical protein
MSEFSVELEQERRQKSAEEKKESSAVPPELPLLGTVRPSVIPAQLRGTGTVMEGKPGGMESVMSGPSAKEARPSQVPPIATKDLEAPDRFKVQLEAMFPDFNITSNPNFTDEDWQFWNSDRIADFFTSLVAGGFLDRQDKGATIKLFPEDSDGPGGRGIRVNIAAKKALSVAESRPFSLSQVFFPGKEGQTIYVEGVVAPGKGRQFVQSGLLTYAKQVKVRKLELKASGIGGTQEGVFAWARYGFVPTAESWEKMRRSGLNTLRSETGELSSDTRDALERLLLNPSPQALRWVVYLSWKEKGATTKFLNRMLTASVGWDGELDLADPKSLAWINTYAGAAKAENELTTFRELLPGLPEEQVSPKQEQPANKGEIEEEQPGEDLVDDAVIEFLVSAIQDKEGTLDELYDEYKDRPEVIRRVKEKLGIE